MTTTCPTCRKSFEEATQVFGKTPRAPRPGDFYVCIACSQVSHVEASGLVAVELENVPHRIRGDVELSQLLVKAMLRVGAVN